MDDEPATLVGGRERPISLRSGQDAGGRAVAVGTAIADLPGVGGRGGRDVPGRLVPQLPISPLMIVSCGATRGYESGITGRHLASMTRLDGFLPPRRP